MKTRNAAAFAAFIIGVVLARPLFVACAEWKTADPIYSWSFPSDHWPHRHYKTEWWYFTGHLKSAETPPREFGYQFTFFRIGVVDKKMPSVSEWATAGIIMGHAAITDVKGNRHLFSSVLYRETPLLGQFNVDGKNPIAWSQAPAGSAGTWRLGWNGRAFDFAMIDTSQNIGFQLSTTPEKPMIFEGPNGYSQKNKQNDTASEYYSFTRLSTTGNLIVDGSTLEVSGESWMDKEFSSNQLDKNQKGWDWFSLQLNDGRELMLYVLRGRDDKMDFGRGSVVPPHPKNASDVRYLSSDDWKIRALDTWTSPATGVRYPSGWSLELPSEKISLRIEPLVKDQENRGTGPGLPYWEGAVNVTDSEGKMMGRGYVELTGWGTN